MKRVTQMTFLILCMLASVSIQAQFLKKLGKKVNEAAENTVTRKSADKTSDEVGKGMDGIFSSKKKKGDNKISTPDHYYKFDYHYQMEMTTKKNTVMMDYYFKPNSDYAGMAMTQSGMNIFMVFDYNKEAAYSFMKTQGRKMYASTSLDLNSDNDWINDEYTQSDYKVTTLPNKTFLGYSCQGKQIENKEWKFTMYYTKEVEVSFQNILNASKDSKNNPSVLSKYFKDAEDGLMMYMQSVDKKQRGKNSITMKCVDFEKEKHDFTTKDYQPMGF